MRSGHYTAYAKARAANSHLSNLVLHGDIPQGKRAWETGIQRIMAIPGNHELESSHLYFLLTDFEMQSTKGQWFHISDTHVQAVPTAKVLSSQAYLLFYERVL